MLSLNWNLRKARIWLDELPDWHYETSEMVERQFSTHSANQATNNQSAIELYVPLGGRFFYGGLAVAFVPAVTRQLVVQAPVLDSFEHSWSDGLPDRKVETAFKGLLPEHAQGIVEGIGTVPDTQLPSGTLHIVGAVQGAIGSSPWMFKLLSRIVIQLLTLEKGTIAEERLIKMIQEEWTQTRKV